MQMQREMADPSGMSGPQRMDFLQADNELRTFAKETGGQAYFPRFQGEYGRSSRCCTRHCATSTY